ncbi:MAG: glycine cleavage system aminomethyltransferase GcvT [Nitrospira sp.]|nr:glycine cleavage system aminomethyltransferase GcvT [Candidatus Manganitrophaceae bacterium]HIL33918.1 glycine cleavage system aminomethyltransferase GcvT [Candidatus Manganitrophaceae bacterium]
MKKTPLYEIHVESGAKMVPFSGWEMPLSYTGVPDEHRNVRSAVGLFDVSHMGRFELSGKGAEAYLEHMTPRPIYRMQRRGAQYSMLLKPDGGIIDDIYIYKKGVDRFLLIVNSANSEKDFRWLRQNLPADSQFILQNVTAETALVALQGPKSWEVLGRILPEGTDEISLRKFVEAETLPAPEAKILIARTGYTGEKGYELVIPGDVAAKVWNALMEAGKGAGILPVGLGARDTLRLEMAYPLYGNDIDETTMPLQAGLERFIDFEKDFVGKEALLQEKEKGLGRKLICFELLVGGIPRSGQLIYSDQKEVGKVTSGNYSPSMRKGIGMGYVDLPFCDEGGELLIDIRGKVAPAVIVKKPFYKKKR